MVKAEWTAFRDRLATVARVGSEEYGLTVACTRTRQGSWI